MNSIRETWPNRGSIERNLGTGGGCRIIPVEIIAEHQIKAKKYPDALETLKRRKDLHFALPKLAEAYFYIGKIKEAKKITREAFEIINKVKDSEEKVYSFTYLAMAHKRIGNAEEGERFLATSIELNNKERNFQYRVSKSLTVGRMLIESGFIPEGKKSYPMQQKMLKK
jgi:tetratricopeptide (TPR) repeat protein